MMLWDGYKLSTEKGMMSFLDSPVAKKVVF